jgi:hypothetical protein
MSEIKSHRLNIFDVRVFDEPTEDIINLLSHTYLGTPGGLQYQLVDTPSRIRHYREIYFITLYRSDKLIGLLAVCPRSFSIDGISIPAYYIRYLAIASPFQSKTEAGKKRYTKVREKFEKSVKEQIIELFRNASLLGIPGYDPSGPSLFYAFVEPNNVRSVNLVEQANYHTTGMFYTLPFSRRKPCADPRVRRSGEPNRQEISRKLEQYWKLSNGWTSDFIQHENNYFVLEENGTIIAGVQAHPATYRLKHMPGLKGFLFLHVFSHLPYFRKILHKFDLRFLAFEGLFCEKGLEEKIPILFESCCALMNYHAGLVWLDERSPLYLPLRHSKEMGLIGKLAGKEPVSVYVNFQNMDEKMKKVIKEKDFYISAFDSI